MDKLKKARTPIRGLITKSLNELDAELNKQEKDTISLKTRYERLNELQTKIEEVDQSIFNEMLSDPEISEEEQLNEAVACENILTRIVAGKLKIDNEVTKIATTETLNNEDGRASTVQQLENVSLNCRKLS